jgi:hypothetical protein
MFGHHSVAGVASSAISLKDYESGIKGVGFMGKG